MGSAHRRLPLVEVAVGARLPWSARGASYGFWRSARLIGGFLGYKIRVWKKRDDSFVSFHAQNIASRLRVWQLVEKTSGGTRQREETSG